MTVNAIICLLLSDSSGKKIKRRQFFFEIFRKYFWKWRLCVPNVFLVLLSSVDSNLPLIPVSYLYSLRFLITTVRINQISRHARLQKTFCLFKFQNWLKIKLFLKCYLPRNPVMTVRMILGISFRINEYIAIFIR